NGQTDPRTPCRSLLCRKSPLSRVGTSRQSRKSLQFAPLPSSSGESRLSRREKFANWLHCVLAPGIRNKAIMTDPAPRSPDPAPSQLHLGWKMDVRSDDDPAYLRAKGVPAHIAVIAQSGSGKSFMLGRMLEEIAAKTLARFLILDPNSDFVKFSVVDNDAWTRPIKGKFMRSDTLEAVKSRWDGVGFNALTDRPRESLGGVSGHVPISLSWSQMSREMKEGSLGISAATHPEEHAAFQQLERAIEGIEIRSRDAQKHSKDWRRPLAACGMRSFMTED